ncbi:FMN-binding negative transcriptional regulator [Actinomadura sp. KC216]|uniref:FMN-binding negative transcriptional regulator n=1 Tax=Actinomadura sp. KC216 TaxID=2530370 RepID=UPI0010517315|nr:FMN-binding negative transcriptional regulator [Actinomadura sp. KC216]TDB90689.1 FMN-binding negative transcriptional regulator [Actinomadura sp. KC216]
MLIPQVDRASREESMEFLRTHEFGQLVAAGRGRDVPVVVPTQFVVIDDETLMLHLSAKNSVWAAIDENPMVMLSVAAHYSYIPGYWRVVGDEDPDMGIPTIYYAAVQARCEVEMMDTTEAKLEVLRAQLRQKEPDRKHDPDVHAHLLPGIRGARLAIRELDGKFKFGGNMDVPHRRAVAERLTERGRPADLAGHGYAMRNIERDERKAAAESASD